MNILAFILAVNFAIIPTGGIDMYNNLYLLSPTEDYKIAFIAEAILLNTVHIGGDLSVYMDPSYSSFNPKILDSIFYIQFDFDWIRFQFLNRCTHPICAWILGTKINKYYESWYRELSVTFIAKFDVIKREKR